MVTNEWTYLFYEAKFLEQFARKINLRASCYTIISYSRNWCGNCMVDDFPYNFPIDILFSAELALSIKYWFLVYFPTSLKIKLQGHRNPQTFIFLNICNSNIFKFVSSSRIYLYTYLFIYFDFLTVYEKNPNASLKFLFNNIQFPLKDIVTTFDSVWTQLFILDFILQWKQILLGIYSPWSSTVAILHFWHISSQCQKL